MARPLNVLVVEQGRGVWGAQRYLLRLAPLLRERGVELTLAGPRSLELHQLWLNSGFRAVHLNVPIDRSIRGSAGPSVSGIAREGYDGLTVARRIAALARSGGYDALWANGHWTHFDTSVAGRMSRKPVVLHLHEEALPGLGTWLRTGAVRLASRAVAVSHAVAAGLPQSTSERVHVIPNGVDAQAMSPGDQDTTRLRAELRIPDGGLMVLAATRIDPTKRIEDLIECQRSLNDPRVHLIIAGATSGFPDYERRVREDASRLRNAVTFCGNRDDMTALFRASDVVVHAGTVEGMPLTLIEAQACAKPVIAYDVAGVAEAVRDGLTGILVPPTDVTGLTGALRGLVADATRRAEMGAAARLHVMAHHRIETQADRNVAVLAAVCGRPDRLVG
ncbi:glycosyltransferase family 4 protein [Mycolicibacterium moriokaense]|uniref:Glycosyltransferase involved in cell wall biosynthesis n=1 Tax=Mycolicibacterium moriokaense TaxID=39691 RepID=A0A318HGD1_9MYCO|nr:glycosyltransferase family 4 protein [Mycolicibacterium moriokaense]PXW99123.1 glycosyltransferase involved in cell wall biosynthesis [Mycolicibacterium moriokaense]